MKPKNVKIPSPSKPHLHKWQGYWRLEPPLSGRQCDSVSDWEKAHFFRHRLNNDINAALPPGELDARRKQFQLPWPRDWVDDILDAARPIGVTRSNWVEDAHRVEEQMRPPKPPSIWPFALSSLIVLAIFMTVLAYITQ